MKHVGKRTRSIPYKSDHGVDHSAPNSDINVTPLVDVCLVLLIIFMVVTPMLGRGKDVRLPVLSDAAEHKEGDQVFVSVDDAGAWIEQDLYNDKASFLGRLEEDLKIAFGKAAAVGYKGPILFVKGDRDTDYGRVRTVMEWINSSDAAVTDIALVVDKTEN
ncbi:MAG: biopolymer transporter ExbD [Deltaproteobacteria bacterium]|nr:biopolymer transporter ExbD [Deltaproteobacteria bacterium]MBP7292025.1 biopolymer transporter ExbD [Nannocystaceae bacterium]